MEMEWLVKEFLLDCQARNLSPRTISGYKKQLGYFLHYLSKEHGVVTLEGMKPTHLRQYIVTLQRKGNKASYINDLIKPVKRICAYAMQEGYTEDNPTKRVKNVKEPKVLMYINFEKKTIELSKTEMTNASRYGSQAYNDLMAARRDNPDFRIVEAKVRKPAKTPLDRLTLN